MEYCTIMQQQNGLLGRVIIGVLSQTTYYENLLRVQFEN